MQGISCYVPPEYRERFILDTETTCCVAILNMFASQTAITKSLKLQ
jgi:hypothetical protein